MLKYSKFKNETTNCLNLTNTALHTDIEVSYKILQLEIPKLVLILHYLACFQKGLFGGNFGQKHPWSFRG
jgi:hypothetical protein